MAGGRAACVANGCPFWVRSCLISGMPGKVTRSQVPAAPPSRDRLQTAPGITNSPTNTRLAGPTLPCAGWLLQDTRLRKSNHHRSMPTTSAALDPPPHRAHSWPQLNCSPNSCPGDDDRGLVRWPHWMTTPDGLASAVQKKNIVHRKKREAMIEMSSRHPSRLSPSAGGPFRPLHSA
jgi:hypothetical protein